MHRSTSRVAGQEKLCAKHEPAQANQARQLDLYEPYRRTTAAVDAIDALPQRPGHFVPFEWYSHPRLALGSGAPNTNAILILSDICYWHQSVEDRCPTTGRVLGRRKKFSADMFQKQYCTWERQLKLSRKQVKTAVDFLVARGLIRREMRDLRARDGSILRNRMFVEPIGSEVAALYESASDPCDALEESASDPCDALEESASDPCDALDESGTQREAGDQAEPRHAGEVDHDTAATEPHHAVEVGNDRTATEPCSAVEAGHDSTPTEPCDAVQADDDSTSADPRDDLGGHHMIPSMEPRHAAEGTCTKTTTKTSTKTSTERENTPIPPKGAGEVFLKFWDLWPRHYRKSDRLRCAQIWHERGFDSIGDLILAGVERWKKSETWARENGRFIPKPLTWLRQQRWEAPVVDAEPAGDDDWMSRRRPLSLTGARELMRVQA